MRELGRALNLPESIVNRHPFPGPGLAIRILCAEHPFQDESFDTTQLVCQEITNQFAGGIKCTLLPIKSVGVQGIFIFYFDFILMNHVKRMLQ